MKRITLPSGEILRLGIRHARIPISEVPFHVSRHWDAAPDEHGREKNCRITDVWLKEGEKPVEGEDPTLLEARAYCSFHDNFCKRSGRKAAAQKLLEKLKGLFYSKEARAAVFQAINPEYRSKPSRRKRCRPQ